MSGPGAGPADDGAGGVGPVGGAPGDAARAPRVDRLLDAVCGSLAALALFAIMALTLVDVAGRKLLSTSVPGSLEVTELLMVVVIFAALPLVSLHREHVAFDALDARLPAPVRRAQDFVVDALCAALLGGVGWLMWVKGGRMASYGDTTAQLKLPLGPFVAAMGVACALAAAVQLLLVWRALRRPAPGAPA